MTPAAAASVAGDFEELAGRPADGVWSSPGRVNLIGEHVDYNGGRVLPLGIQLRTSVAVARRPDTVVRLWSRQWPGEVAQTTVDRLVAAELPGWARYAAGSLWALADAGHHVGGIDLWVDGDVPPGSGLSSSAALECAVGLAVSDLFGADLTLMELAVLAQRAEEHFVGVPCGLMDQVASSMAVADHALAFDTERGSVEPVALDLEEAGARLLVVDTRTAHAHAGGAYAGRRRSCVLAAGRLGIASLRQVGTTGLASALAAVADDPVLVRRVRHVVTEDDRCARAVGLLRGGHLAEVGPLLSASHASLRDDFEVSTPELDAAVDAALAAGAWGARLTGGGFGGSIIALVPVGAAAATVEAVTAALAAIGAPTPGSFEARPSGGVRRDA